MVSIFDQLQLLEIRECRVVVLPDRRRAAMWRGLAYPLLPPGAQIDVDGEAIPPGLCSEHENAAGSGFALIDGAEEAYLVLAGDFAACERSAAVLQNARYDVLRTGRYLGEPIGDFGGDWFVRFAKQSSHRTSIESLQSLFVDVLGNPNLDSVGAEQSSSDVRSRLIAAELLASRAREAGLRAEISKLKGLSARGDDAKVEADALRKALEEEQRLRAAAELAAAEASVPQAPLVLPRSVPSTKLIDEIQIVISSLLPRIDLVRDGLTVIATEFATRRALYRTLAELQDQPDRLPSNWKKLQGVDNWWERHLSNGQDDAGRAYARRGTDREWSVLISHKGEQSRDLAWLARQ